MLQETQARDDYDNKSRALGECSILKFSSPAYRLVDK